MISNTDIRQNPEWLFNGFKHLSKSNPKKYKLSESSFMEGMMREYKLFDISKDKKTQVGSTIIYSCVSQKFVGVENG